MEQSQELHSLEDNTITRALNPDGLANEPPVERTDAGVDLSTTVETASGTGQDQKIGADALAQYNRLATEEVPGGLTHEERVEGALTFGHESRIINDALNPKT